MDIETSDQRIPVTLLTGFLGAGKTTLLNHLIQDPEAGRTAVIINEFGDVGLDHDLIEASTEETILMESGCLCCSIRGDLLKTLGSLIARRNRGALSFDRVVIETTGIADPGPILHSLVVDGIVAPHFRMDGVVTVADAATGTHTLDTQFEAVHQLAMADLIILTKTDLVTPLELSRFQTRLNAVNKTAQRVQADHGRVPTGLLFGLSAMRESVTPVDMASWLGQAEKAPLDPLAGLSGLNAPKSAPTLLPFAQTTTSFAPLQHSIASASLEVPDPIAADVFDLWLDTLIALKGADVLRIKGIVHIADMEWPFVFHGVQHIFDAPVPLKTWAGTDTTSRVVVIARDMTEAEIKRSLDMLLMTPSDVGVEVGGMMAHSAK